MYLISGWPFHGPLIGNFKGDFHWIFNAFFMLFSQDFSHGNPMV